MCYAEVRETVSKRPVPPGPAAGCEHLGSGARVWAAACKCREFTLKEVFRGFKVLTLEQLL